MKKISCLLLITFIIMLMPVSSFAATVTFDGGDGTANNPYLISTVEQLAAISQNMTAHYKLKNDITDKLTTPIGGIQASTTFDGTPFTGSLDGDEHYINIEFTNKSNKYYAALFPVAGAGATIKDLTIKGSINSGNYTGSLIGSVVADSGTVTVTNVENQADVTSQNISGGIIGYVKSGKVEVSGCINRGCRKVDQWVKDIGHGGIIGRIESAATGSITNCINYGAIAENSSDAGATNSNSEGIGGIVGYNAASSCPISKCYNYGNISVGKKRTVGGIVGLTYSSVLDCANIADISAGTQTGGIVGYTYGKVNGCYNTGTVSSASDGGRVAGIAGRVRGHQTAYEISGCYNIGKVEYTVPVTSTYRNGAIIGDSYNASDGVNVQRCYDASLSGIPFYRTSSSTNAVSDNYQLSENPAAETALAGVTYVTLSDLRGKAEDLGNKFEAAVPTAEKPYNLPQIKENEMTEKKAIYRVTLTAGSNGSFDINGEKYVKLNDKITVTVTPDSGYLIKELLYNNATVRENDNAEYTYITPEITQDSTITASFATYRANPELSSHSSVFKSNDALELDGVTYEGVKVVAFSKVLDAYKHTLKEYGMIFARENDMDILTYEDGIKAEALKKSDEGSYGILFYGTSLQPDTDYFARPYAVFEKDGESQPVIVYGDVITMHTDI